MSVETLRSAIEVRAAELLPAALARVEIRMHRRHKWRTCECSHCELKRKATLECSYIGGGMPMSRMRRMQIREYLVDHYHRRLEAERERIL